LVVDDSAVIRKLLTNTIKRNCDVSEVVQATNGKEAVDAAINGEFALIVLDWNMPKMSGIAALKKIRGFDKSTPIVMVTSEAERSRVIEALEAGATNYFVKPFEPKTLVEKLKPLL
jgi:two-component system, chemotaxis family, chemotaxis protein CheY